MLKIVGWGAVGLLGLVAVGAGAIYIVSNSQLKKTYTVTVAPVAIPTDAAAIARGRHLVNSRGCSDCHGADLGGAKVIDDPAMGLIHGPNITRGTGGVPGTYRDEDYVRAIRHGVAQAGRALFLMPSEEYSTFSDADMGALVAFLKSAPPVNRERVPLSFGPVARGLIAAGKIKLAASVIDHGAVKPSTVTPGESVQYGRYVAASCMGCHGPNFSGGRVASGPPDWPPAANLTTHAEGRIGRWQETDFVHALRAGKRPDGSEINPVMPRAFGQMNDVELKALWTFFKTLPPVATGLR